MSTVLLNHLPSSLEDDSNCPQAVQPGPPISRRGEDEIQRDTETQTGGAGKGKH